MSITKRSLESLPANEQDAILGRPDEWEEDDGISTGRMAVLCLPTLLKGREERRRAGLNPDGPGALERPGEWVDDAENEPSEEELAEWARALMEEDAEEMDITSDIEKDDGPVDCACCGGTFSESAPRNGVCAGCELTGDLDMGDKFTERDEAQLVKPQPVGVKLDGYDI